MSLIWLSSCNNLRENSSRFGWIELGEVSQICRIEPDNNARPAEAANLRRNMKNLLKISALAAVLAASASFASAETIQLGSYATSGSALGNANTALNYAGFQAVSTTPSSGTGTSYFLDPSTPVWNAALPNSTWVGYQPTAGPIGTVNPAFGYYTFTTTFTAASSAPYSGS